LTRWLEAMSEAQQMLCEGLTRVAAPQPPEPEHEAGAAGPMLDTAQPAAPAGLFVRGEQFATTSAAHSNPAGGSEANCAVDAERDDPAPATQAAQEPGVNVTSEEEALLGTLDETTARAVRVKRRLNSGKTLQELIEQVQASQAKTDNAARSTKRWWRKNES